MDFAPARGDRPPAIDSNTGLLSLKVVVAGGCGVGKTTFIKSLSEISTLRTAQVTESLSVCIDDVAVAPDQTATVAMGSGVTDFGRITIDAQLILYLFKAPRQSRSQLLWDELTRGAIGAIVLVDTRRMDDCFTAIDYCDARQLPFTVAINQFPGTPDLPMSSLRNALSIPSDCPVVQMDARDPRSSLNTLIALVEHALSRSRG